MTWKLILPLPTPSGNIIKQMHWSTYRKTLEKWWLLVRAADGFFKVPRASGRRMVIITRHGRKHLDRDNLYAGVKPLLDVLRPERVEHGIHKTGKKAGQAWIRTRIGHGLIVDDAEQHLELYVIQAPLRKGEKPYTEVSIEEWGDEEVRHAWPVTKITKFERELAD